jgi:hypothetical protein
MRAQYRKNYWLSDPATYPLIVCLGGAMCLCSGFGLYFLTTAPDVQISPLKRYVSMSHEDSNRAMYVRFSRFAHPHLTPFPAHFSLLGTRLCVTGSKLKCRIGLGLALGKVFFTVVGRVEIKCNGSKEDWHYGRVAFVIKYLNSNCCLSLSSVVSLFHPTITF